MIFRIRLLPLILFSGTFILLCSLQSAGTTPQNLDSTFSLFPWLAENWQTVALIISEVASLISVKYSGIFKSVLAFFTACIKKKCFLSSTLKS